MNPNALAPDDLEAWTERAAIMEYDGGLSRADADRAAWELLIGETVQECARRNLIKGGQQSPHMFGDVVPSTGRVDGWV